MVSEEPFPNSPIKNMYLDISKLVSTQGFCTEVNYGRETLLSSFWESPAKTHRGFQQPSPIP